LLLFDLLREKGTTAAVRSSGQASEIGGKEKSRRRKNPVKRRRTMSKGEKKKRRDRRRPLRREGEKRLKGGPKGD